MGGAFGGLAFAEAFAGGALEGGAGLIRLVSSTSPAVESSRTSKGFRFRFMSSNAFLVAFMAACIGREGEKMQRKSWEMFWLGKVFHGPSLHKCENARLYLHKA